MNKPRKAPGRITPALAWLVLACVGCANSRPIYVPRPRFDPAEPGRVERSRSPLLPPLRRRSDPMQIEVDAPVFEDEPEIRFESLDEADP